MKRMGFMLALFVVFAAIPLHTRAVEKGSISSILHDNDTNKGIAGAHFKLYKIGEYIGESNGVCSYKLTSGFADYPVDVSHINWSDAWNAAALAGTINDYIVLTGEETYQEGDTDNAGRFTAAGLENGLYLLSCDTLEITAGDIVAVYNPQPVLFELSHRHNNMMELNIKYDKRIYETEKDTVSCNVIKVWKDAGAHPGSVSVVLMDGGDIKDRQILDDNNNWSYVWDGLDASGSWRIAEENVPDEYQVVVEQEGNTFTIINTAVKNNNDDDTKPGDGDDAKPDGNKNDNKGDDTDPKDDGSKPGNGTGVKDNNKKPNPDAGSNDKVTFGGDVNNSSGGLSNNNTNSNSIGNGVPSGSGTTVDTGDDNASDNMKTGTSRTWDIFETIRTGEATAAMFGVFGLPVIIGICWPLAWRKIRKQWTKSSTEKGV